MQRDELIGFLECMLSVLKEKDEDWQLSENDSDSLLTETNFKCHFYISLMKKIIEDKGLDYPGDNAIWKNINGVSIVEPAA